MSDARFEDGGERPLRLLARDGDDLRVISALVQDAVLSMGDMGFQQRTRRFSLLLNRFRWEDRTAAQASGRPFERVRAVLEIADVLQVSHMGLDRREGDTVLSLLSLAYEPAADNAAEDGLAGPGRLVLTFAGDGALALQVECLEVLLHDVTRPYVAPSGRAPDHALDDASGTSSPAASGPQSD